MTTRQIGYNVKLKGGLTFHAYGYSLLGMTPEEKAKMKQGAYARFSIMNREGDELCDTFNLNVIFRDFGKYMLKSQVADLKDRYE